MARLSEYLPSRQFQAVALSVVGAFTLVIFASKLADNPNVVPEEQRDFEANISTSTLVAITQKIIENNSDWESVMASTTLVKNTSSNSTNTPLTATDIVARDLFAKYLAVKQSGGKLDSKTEEELIQSVLTSTDLTPRYRMYTKGELKIIYDNSPESIKDYGNNMGKILRDNTVKNTNDILIVQKSIDSNNKDMLKQLDEKISAHKKVIQTSMMLSVPSDAVEIQLNFINTSSKELENLMNLRNIFSDPISGLFAVSNYTNTLNEFVDFYSNSKQFFISKNVSFSTNDPGYLFVNYK
jgi:hypothetical protein